MTPSERFVLLFEIIAANPDDEDAARLLCGFCWSGGEYVEDIFVDLLPVIRAGLEARKASEARDA